MTNEQIQEHAELIKDICDELFDLRFDDDYSGRGMYGATCVSVSGDPHDIDTFLMEYGRRCGEEDLRPVGWSRDSMGLGVVIYSQSLKTNE